MLSILLGVVASISMILGVFVGLTADKLASETIAHSRSIEESFQKAIAFVESQKKAIGRLPSLVEYSFWSSQFPDQPFSPKYISLVEGSFPKEVIGNFGTPPLGSYLLVCWRGEWNEYYASWANRSTLQFNQKKYHVSGSGIGDGAFVVICSAFILYLAIKVWPNKCVHPIAEKAGSG
jgi:hypothetical protein